MTLAARLLVLERQCSGDGRCGVCRRRPAVVIVEVGDPEGEAALAPCPVCAWVPPRVVLLDDNGESPV